MSVWQESIENVIREKDTEIRRLKALWSPADLHNEQLDGVGSLEEVAEATKILNAPEFGSGKHKFRYGISAENLIPDKSTIAMVKLQKNLIIHVNLISILIIKVHLANILKI